MSLSGLCEICQSPGVEYTCDRCGQLVCNRHFDVQLGVCTDCAAEIGEPSVPQRGGEGGNPDVNRHQF